jgi:CheY-like chemotaxis protein
MTPEEGIREKKERKSILIADDNADILYLLEITLTQARYNIIKAVNGEEAVNLAKSYLPDIIILDLCMPVMDGVRAASILAQDSTTAKIPIIFISALYSKEDKKQRELVQGCVIIPKDSDAQLLAEIKKHIG